MSLDLLYNFFPRRPSTNLFLKGEVSLTPNPQPGGPGLRVCVCVCVYIYIYPPETGLPSNIPGTPGGGGWKYPAHTTTLKTQCSLHQHDCHRYYVSLASHLHSSEQISRNTIQHLHLHSCRDANSYPRSITMKYVARRSLFKATIYGNIMFGEINVRSSKTTDCNNFWVTNPLVAFNFLLKF
jgi:hypothetical protein